MIHGDPIRKFVSKFDASKCPDTLNGGVHYKRVDIWKFSKDMPEIVIYYPCITIKAYDSRGFGCFKYIGICIIPSVYIFLEQLITEEDYDAQIHEIKSILRPPWTRRQPVAICK